MASGDVGAGLAACLAGTQKKMFSLRRVGKLTVLGGGFCCCVLAEGLGCLGCDALVSVLASGGGTRLP